MARKIYSLSTGLIAILPAPMSARIIVRGSQAHQALRRALFLAVTTMAVTTMAVITMAIITMALGLSARASASEVVLHNFTDTGVYNPTTLSQDGEGNLYGVAYRTIFELKKTPSGSFNLIKLFTVPNPLGSPPVGPVAIDPAGNVYGITQNGLIFELTHGASGWTESDLYQIGFGSITAVAGGLILDSAGNIYGTTENGGSGSCSISNKGCGTAFELSPGPMGWSETVLYNFSVGNNGYFPTGRLVFDSKGNLFGTTKGGNVVFELLPVSGGWTETKIRNFGPGTTLNDGLAVDADENVYGTEGPFAFKLTRSPGGSYWEETVLSTQGWSSGLILDNGSLYGTADNGTTLGGQLLKLTPSGSSWTTTTLYTFTGGWNGFDPSGGVIVDSDGSIYVTDDRYAPNAPSFGEFFAYDLGQVLKISPASGGTWDATILLCVDSSDGQYPAAGLISDTLGNLYGTTTVGGRYGAGTVFELSPTSNGWKKTNLYNFTGHLDGGIPLASLVFDSAGNLYGTTQVGGNETNCVGGCGTVFKLSPVKSGWEETVLYAFMGASDGELPAANLIFDKAGNLYGTTPNGGISNCKNFTVTVGCGIIFELSPELSPGSGTTWKESVVFRFTGGSDEGIPTTGLIFDAAGNLYGTTSGGGVEACIQPNPLCGTAFELSHVSSSWQLTTLYTFTGGSDGGVPAGPLLFDGKALFGATVIGGHVNQEYGTDSDGTVFELTPTSSGWAESVIYEFALTENDGAFPSGGLIKDTAGNLYGNTSSGGPYNYYFSGTIYELSASSGGAWTETIVNYFDIKDGSNPEGGLLFDPTGNLYGVTEYGGSSFSPDFDCGCGTAFKVTP